MEIGTFYNKLLNSLSACGNICCLMIMMISFAKSLDSDQAKQYIRSDLDPNFSIL